MRAIAILVMVGLVAASAPLVDADRDTFSGLGRYQIFRLSTPDRLVLHFDVSWEGAATAYGVYLNTTPPLQGFAWFLDSGAARASLGVGSVAYDLPVSEGTGEAGWGIEAYDPGSHDVLILWSSGISAVQQWVEGPGTVTLLADGPATTYFGHELDGGAWARVGAPYSGAHAGVDRHLEFSIEQTLVGWFAEPPVLIGHHLGGATLTGPHGTDVCYETSVVRLSETSRPCIFNTFSGPNARGPGDYRLDLTSVGAGAWNIPLMVFADIERP